MLASSPIKRKKFAALNLPWEPSNGNGRISKTPTPDFTSQCSSTPVIRSPYAGRHGVSDDGDSSVYSVDTDGYYTSMHTDSGLWCSTIRNKLAEEIPETTGFRERKESQSSVSTTDNSSINSFLSKTATECSSNSGSLKRHCPDPPPRISSNVANNAESNKDKTETKDPESEGSNKSHSPQLQNGSTSESDHEVGDRIRVKTTITANRYPSMCAVSPETSDDEISESKNKTLSNINIIVAEVHREDKCDKNGSSKNKTNDSHNNIPKSPINMYRSETPLPSNFSNSVQSNQPVATSTPRSSLNVSTFTPDLNESRKKNDSSSLKLSDLGSNFDSDDDVTVSESPSQSQSDKSLIPLKYAQRITVTPIARSESPTSNTGTIKRTPLRPPLNLLASSGAEKSAAINKKDPPSYVSFQAPDSPISTMSSMNKSDKLPNSPNNSLPRAVARVTLDPSGKVVYSSNSLGRTTSPNKHTVERTYATLPLCQTYTDSKPITPISDMLKTSTLKVSTRAAENSSNSHLYSKSLAPMVYSSFRGSTSSANTNSEKNSISQICNQSATTEASFKSNTKNTVSAKPNENSSQFHCPLTNTVQSIFKNENNNNSSFLRINKQNSMHQISSNSSSSMTPLSLKQVSRSPASINTTNSNQNQSAISNSSPVNYSSFKQNIRTLDSTNNTVNKNQNQALLSSSPVTYSSFKCSPGVSFSENNSNPNQNNIVCSPSVAHSSFEYDMPISAQTTDSNNSKEHQIISNAVSPITYSSFKNDLKTSVSMNDRGMSNNNQFSISKPMTSSPTFTQNQNITPSRSNTERHDFSFRPSRGGRFCRSYFPSHLISPPPSTQSGEKFVKGVYSPGLQEKNKHSINPPEKPLTENPAWQNYSSSCSQKSEPSNKYSNSNEKSSYYSQNVPNSVNVDNLNAPNSAKTSTGQIYDSQNNNIPSVKLKQTTTTNTYNDIKNPVQKTFVSLRPPDLIPSGESPPSTLDITSSAGGYRKLNQANLAKASESENEPVIENGKNLKSLSATELFAIIHSSKKKHNIKSDSEKSMSPMSSRSVSPALSTTSLSKLQPVETGVLSKRNDGNLNSPDKTKWCNSMPSNFKKQTVHEKIGPSKPTSMHDFKMLLLQARTGNGDNSPRPSAAELLKVSPTRNSPVPQTSNSKSPMPFSLKSPTSHYSSSPIYSSGHGTVPIKRNMRTRSPYLTRYDSAYPPIMEDCLEETESCYEDSECLNQSQVCRMPDTIQRQTSIAKATSTWV